MLHLSEHRGLPTGTEPQGCHAASHSTEVSCDPQRKLQACWEPKDKKPQKHNGPKNEEHKGTDNAKAAADDTGKGSLQHQHETQLKLWQNVR